MENKIKKIDWTCVTNDLNNKGFSLIENFIANAQCQQLINLYSKPTGYRKTVKMARYRFGLGEYKYFDYPLPDLIQSLRTHLYSYLVPVANSWMNRLRINKQFPNSLQELQESCRIKNQLKPTPLILKYEEGGFNTLHQDLYGEVYFPLQAAIFLNEPGTDFNGGEFVLTQQVPRGQSKAFVLTPKKGSMIVFTTNFRPAKGAKGYYRENMKHGVSEVTSGSRYTVGIIFHDAVN